MEFNLSHGFARGFRNVVGVVALGLASGAVFVFGCPYDHVIERGGRFFERSLRFLARPRLFSAPHS
jgi:hypothetical protein